jgi:Co/Zn/Cd efflux system component
MHSHLNEAAKQTISRLALSLGLTLIFVFAEAIAGWVSTAWHC